MEDLQQVEALHSQDLPYSHFIGGSFMLEGAENRDLAVNGEWARSLVFRLDGQTYLATEDDNDDYRSTLGFLVKTSLPVTNTFAPVAVTFHDASAGYASSGDRLGLDGIVMVSLDNGKVLAEIGTDYSGDDLYPCAALTFNPANLPHNDHLTS